MNLRNTFLLILFIGLGLRDVSSQSVEFSKYQFPNNRNELSDALSAIKEGDKYWDQGPGMVDFAIDAYMKAQKFNPDNSLLNYKIGRCYLWHNDKTEAIRYLERAYELDPRISLELEYNDIHYLLARAYHLNYEFDKAIAQYTEHKNSLTPERLTEQAELIDKRVQECETAKEMVGHPVRVFVDNLGSTVNSSYPDYSPLVVPEEDMIMFTSSRENTTGGERDKDSYYFEDIYVTYYKGGTWSVPDNAYDLNSNNHDATAGISSDGLILYIYKSAGGNDLYECPLVGNQYKNPSKLPNEINGGLKQSSASLTFDKRTLYFTSIREDGYGGLDIFFSKKDDRDRWTKGMNIGAAINTPYDEESVFITPDGRTLYFSSKGHNTMGGYDIFKSEFRDGKWDNPVNLGYPVNTPDDDVFFTMAASGQRGYYSSKKADGYGGQDLYIITFLGAAKPMISQGENELLAYRARPVMVTDLEPKIEQNTILSGVILDAITLEPLQATIEIIDNNKNELIASFESNSITGSYLISLRAGFNYGISVNKEDYLFHSENFDIPEDAVAKKIQKDILLKKVAVGTRIVLNNIFFDFDKATLRPESTAELDRLFKLLIDVPTLKIEISGHTDNIGSATYNQKLSQERAKSVVDYLLGKGISQNRLTYIGYGFTQPVAPNDTEEGRQLNRRTEFKVLEK
ncbi:MAG: OmpA family protein [Bacteroidales bacterium]|nr:OmpA family protein [Bacteroidales bacterium]